MTWLATHDCREQSPEFGIEERERRLVTHGVLGERGLLDLRVDGVAVERRRERRAVLEVRAAGGFGRRRAADMAALRRGHGRAHGLVAGGACHGLAEVDVARLIAG